jgi:hypothetical protein
VPPPSDNDSARFGPLIAPAACSGDHSDLGRLDRLYALRLDSEPLPTSEPEDERLSPTPSPPFFRRPSDRAAPLNPSEEGTPGSRPEPILVICSLCRQPIRRNGTLGTSFCPVHGTSRGFTFIPLTRRPHSEV